MFEEESTDEEEIPDIDSDEETSEDKPSEDKPSEDKLSEGSSSDKTATSSDEGTASSDEGTTSSSSEPKVTPLADNDNNTVPVKKQKKDEHPKTVTVKVNITANVVQLDLSNFTEKQMETSATKLVNIILVHCIKNNY